MTPPRPDPGRSSTCLEVGGSPSTPHRPQDPMSLGSLEQPPPSGARPTLACPKHIPTVLSSPS